MKKLLLLFLVLPFYGIGQNFEYNVLFDGIGDNREYFSGYAIPQTILGTRGAFEIGLEIDKHRIRIGSSKLFEFGSGIDFHKPKIILYYQYSDKTKEFLMGSFARKNRIDFPLAMLTDTLLYYRPNIEGLYTELKWDWGKQNIFADWVSRQTDTIRENFTVGFSGEISHNNLFLQNYFIMYHDAGPAIDIPGDHIKDYIGYALQIGLKTNDDSKIDGYIKAGILNSNYRERNVTNGNIAGNSFFAGLYAKYKNYAIKSTLSAGGSHVFAQGDHFYHAKNYLRTDVIWYLINHENVKGVFNLSFHITDWKNLDQQQQLSIIYKFGGVKPFKQPQE